jgi:hypothetical protein
MVMVVTIFLAVLLLRVRVILIIVVRGAVVGVLAIATFQGKSHSGAVGSVAVTVFIDQ